MRLFHLDSILCFGMLDMIDIEQQQKNSLDRNVTSINLVQ